ncbi:hypothetical protein, partial [Streptomyces sparsogenes]
VATHLDGSDDPDAAWQRVYARLAGQAPRWPRASSIEATLATPTPLSPLEPLAPVTSASAPPR